MTPPDIEVAFHDDRMESIPYDEPTDLVAITVETFTARRAYEISAEFRRRGVPVVMGGMHATLIPQEVALHADAVFTGDAEALWCQVLADARAGRMQPRYDREFYPTYQHPTPPHVRRLLDAAAGRRFGPRYNAEQGIVRLKHATPLRPGVADIDAGRLHNPHVAFFAAANPGHTAGDELVCLTRLTPANLTSAGRRVTGY